MKKTTTPRKKTDAQVAADVRKVIEASEVMARLGAPMSAAQFKKAVEGAVK